LFGPVSEEPRNILKARYWVGSVLAVVGVSAVAGAWLLGTDILGGDADSKAKASASPLEEAAEQAKSRDPRAGKVLELARQGTPGTEKLVSLYAELAGDQSAGGVRELALNALFAEKSASLRLKRVLDAVVSDPTPPEQDPHWPGIVERLADQWTPEMFDKGRDLMLMEKRPRAQRALAASFIELSESAPTGAIGEAQKMALLNDLIDLYPKADPAQKPEIERGVRNLGGDDPADLLTGYGLKPGEKLKLQAEYEQQLAQGVNGLVPNPADDGS
jgi:hypothetical protein